MITDGSQRGAFSLYLLINKDLVKETHLYKNVTITEKGIKYLQENIARLKILSL
jgi:hypothetical protein